MFMSSACRVMLSWSLPCSVFSQAASGCRSALCARWKLAALPDSNVQAVCLLSAFCCIMSRCCEARISCPIQLYNSPYCYPLLSLTYNVKLVRVFRGPRPLESQTTQEFSVHGKGNRKG